MFGRPNTCISGAVISQSGLVIPAMRGIAYRHRARTCSETCQNETGMGFWAAMKGFTGRAFLFLTILFAQVHFCNSEYVRPTGELCTECAATTELAPANSRLATLHGDCHDCCSLRACETPQTQTSLTITPGFHIEFACLPASIEVPSIPVLGEPVQQFWFSTCAPPTGPPQAVSLRGPPTLTDDSSSAGDLFVLLA